MTVEGDLANWPPQLVYSRIEDAVVEDPSMRPSLTNTTARSHIYNIIGRFIEARVSR